LLDAIGVVVIGQREFDGLVERDQVELVEVFARDRAFEVCMFKARLINDDCSYSAALKNECRSFLELHSRSWDLCGKRGKQRHRRRHE
jgi:hypothetical protein